MDLIINTWREDDWPGEYTVLSANKSTLKDNLCRSGKCKGTGIRHCYQWSLFIVHADHKFCAWEKQIKYNTTYG